MKNSIIALIGLSLMLVIVSCQTEEISQTQLQLARYSLKKTDLPSGWKFEGKSWDVDFGGESYSISYAIDALVFITHEVSIHSSGDQAEQAYKEWEADVFDSTYLQPETLYIPLDNEDDYRCECQKTKPDSPLEICFYLQKHNEIISFVHIGFDSRNKDNPTFEEISNILAILDRRLNEVVIDAKPEGDKPAP
jgi:hypothetical protein